jgi:hypothetical protein
MIIAGGFPFPEFDKGKQEQLDPEKAQVNRSLERLYFAPIQLIRLRLFVGQRTMTVNSSFGRLLNPLGIPSAFDLDV